jgi:uncharacterized protein
MCTGLVAAALAYARLIEPNQVITRRIDLAMPSLPDGLDGVRIGFLSDLHLGGPNGNLHIAEQACDVLVREQPHVILLGGDYYDKGHCTGGASVWRRIASTAPTWAVLGNHDHNRGPDEARKIQLSLETAGIPVLNNETVTIPAGEGEIDLIGVNDPYSNRARFAEAIRCHERSSNPRVLLTHAGMIADELRAGAVDLIISGHTHGAQVRISPFAHTVPLDLFWWLDRIKKKRLSPYRQGMFRVNGALLYVSNGLGTTSLPLRFLAPPEVAIITLHRHSGRPQRACDDVDRYVLRNSWEYHRA